MVVVIEVETPTLIGRPAIVSMPTPIGHALGGIAAGVIIVGVSKDSGIRLGGRRLPVFLLFAVLGVLADVDFLIFTPHRYVTHSLGAGSWRSGHSMQRIIKRRFCCFPRFVDSIGYWTAGFPLLSLSATNCWCWERSL